MKKQTREDLNKRGLTPKVINCLNGEKISTDLTSEEIAVLYYALPEKRKKEIGPLVNSLATNFREWLSVKRRGIYCEELKILGFEKMLEVESDFKDWLRFIESREWYDSKKLICLEELFKKAKTCSQYKKAMRVAPAGSDAHKKCALKILELSETYDELWDLFFYYLTAGGSRDIKNCYPEIQKELLRKAFQVADENNLEQLHFIYVYSDIDTKLHFAVRSQILKVQTKSHKWFWFFYQGGVDESLQEFAFQKMIETGDFKQCCAAFGGQHQFPDRQKLALNGMIREAKDDEEKWAIIWKEALHGFEERSLAIQYFMKNGINPAKKRSKAKK